MVDNFSKTTGQVTDHLARSDNCVKNHFYSKLRKSVRKLNKLINDYFREEYKPIKESVLSRIIKTTQSKFKNSTKIDEELADFCNGTTYTTQISRTGSTASALRRKTTSRILRLPTNSSQTFNTSIGTIKRATKDSKAPTRGTIVPTSNLPHESTKRPPLSPALQTAARKAHLSYHQVAFSQPAISANTILTNFRRGVKLLVFGAGLVQGGIRGTLL